MPVSSTAAALFAVARARRKKPYFVAVAQELIGAVPKAVGTGMLDCGCHVA
jgi:hypothetical protein